MLSYGALKLFPVWDPLRGDPRFEKIVASLAPKDDNEPPTRPTINPRGKFEIGHVLFIDIVGYSKLLIEEQKERLDS